MSLTKLLKKQVILASCQFVLFLGTFLSLFLFVSTDIYNRNYDGYYYATGLNSWGTFILISLIVCNVIIFILWIIGIVNAVRINEMTGDSSVLIVFAVITLIFGHLIVAIQQRNKFGLLGIDYQSHILKTASIQNNVASNNSSQSTKAAKIKQAFIDGIISSAEYETKMKELEEQ